MSLSNDSNVVLFTYWVRASAYNTTTAAAAGEGQGVAAAEVALAPVQHLRHERAFEVYIGLTSMVQKRCTPGTGCFAYDMDVVEW